MNLNSEHQALYQRLQERYPGTRFSPLPELPADGGIPDGHRLPEDYKSWMRQIGHGPIGEGGPGSLQIYAGPRLGSQVIPNHQHLGLSEAVVVAGDGEQHHVIYNHRFSPWYIHVVVGELGLMSALERNMTFTDYLNYLCRDAANRPTDNQAWEPFVPWLKVSLVVGIMVLVAAVLIGAWMVREFYAR